MATEEKRFRTVLALVSATAASCVTFAGQPHAAEAQDLIFSGGPIVTMAGNGPEQVEAVLVRNGRIIATGRYETVKRQAGRHARGVDLKGRAMLPGFIDAHGHVTLDGHYRRMADLSPPPVGDVTTMAQLQDKLRAFMREHPEGVVLGYGYDDAVLKEGRHPTRHDLDAVSADRPIGLAHASGHLATVNSAMLAELGIGANTPDPEGGKIRREADGRTPTGVLEEEAMSGLYRFQFPNDLQQSLDAIAAGLEDFAAHGITTAQDAGSLPQHWAVYQAARERDLPIDLAVLAAGSMDLPLEIRREIGGPYKGRVRLVGLKFIVDGSPQGRTAWLSQPYYKVPEGKPQDYLGYPRVDLELFVRKLAEAAENGWQVFAHVNGDAALDALIDGVRKAGLSGQRTIAIHNQIVRPEQLEEMRELDIQPSFFANHTFFWGDWHREVVLGAERADFISPQASAWKAGLTPTAHNDSPIVPPDIMRLVWSSVNRRTKSGDILGPAERISVYRALQQVTINAAWQIHEDDEKGSIEKGKQADFVILERNPLQGDPAQLFEIGVVATINDGTVVFGSLE